MLILYRVHRPREEEEKKLHLQKGEDMVIYWSDRKLVYEDAI